MQGENTLENGIKVQNDLDNLEKWSENNWIKLNKAKYYVLYVGQNNQIHKCKLGNNWLGCCTTKKNT